MATLSNDKPRKFHTGIYRDLEMIASDIIYEGSLVGLNGSGYARPLQAGDQPIGFATKQADNSSGSAGDVKVRCQISGAIELTISGVAITDIGSAVYASDDDTFTTTAGSNSYIGRIVARPESDTALIEFNFLDGVASGEIQTADIAADAITNAKIADDAVSLENLDDEITPSHMIRYAGTHTTSGGSATESITVSGVVAGDIVVATLETEGSSPVTLDAAATNTDAIDLTFSADPSSDHIVSYVVLNAVS